MNKVSLILIILLLFGSCRQTDNSNSGNKSLLEQKQQIENQIDSLNKILSEIDKQLNGTQEQIIPQIEARLLQPENFAHFIELQGSIDTDGNVMIVPQVMGSVKKIYKNEGSKVHKGEIIMLLDDTVVRNQISEIQTQYRLAQTAYERQKRLWNQKIGSEMAYLQAQTKKDALWRKLKTLRSQLEKFKVKAPISGTLDDIMIKEGEMAAPQRPVARLVNLKQVYMQADVSEKYLSLIKKNTPVVIDFPEINKQIKAIISYVGNFIHPNNRTFKIRINLINLDGDLKPNLTGNIKIKDFEAHKVITLPISLIQQDRQGNSFVFVLEPVQDQTNVYKIKKQIIQTSKTYKGHTMIVSGLQAGQVVAGLSGRGLTEGDLVKWNKPENKTKLSTTEKPLSQNNKIVYHTVQKGETLFRIHKKYKVSLADLRKWNQLKNDRLQTGQKIIVKK